MPVTVPIEFRLKKHHLKKGTVVEILVQHEVVGVIYPDDYNGIKLVSAHMSEIDQGLDPEFPIPQIKVRFDPKPYSLDIGEDGKLQIVREDE